MKKQLLFTLFFSLFIAHIGNTKTFDLYQKKSFTSNEGQLPYRILFPENFNRAEKYPFILMLHGAGERGNDNELQLTHGAKLFLRKDIRKKFPAIVVFPQCSRDSYWSNVKRETVIDGKRTFIFEDGGEPTQAMRLLLKLVDSVFKEKYIDRARCYVGGLSMGGMGTFELLNRRPAIFAAAFPICGGAHPNNVKSYDKQIKVWVFHGAEDDVVPPEASKQMVDALKKAKIDVRFTLYPGVGHESWVQAFAEPKLLPWLFSQKRKP